MRLNLICFVLFGVGLGSPVANKLARFNATSADAVASTELTPVLERFKSTDELFDSPFWKNLQKKRNPMLARYTAIYIEDTKSVYHFKSSEWENVDAEEADSIESSSFNADPDQADADGSSEETENVDAQGGITEEASQIGLHNWRPKLRNPKHHKPKRAIEMVEVQYGKGHRRSLPDVAVSNCVSSVLSSGGASYSQTYAWGQTLSVAITPKLAATVAPLGVTASTELDVISLSYKSTGSISCNALPGGKVQVFSSVDFRYFPSARKRDVVYTSDGDRDFDKGAWSRVTGGGKQFDKYGAVFFDLSTIPHHKCVTKTEFLRCDDRHHILDLDDKSVDPRRGLEF